MPIKFKTKNKKRKRVHGFLKRKSSKEGRRVLKSRMRKKRKKLAV
ncbi:MAG: 50S ribosomal protein L34 [Candidatus Portnoybacteria bacterium CG09_land_8_20_14_0_10_44_13]|uniref:Large ribosomal subunit protein bL34 n=3 Tax=Parcubacteria group TaxID=1794811 RepID=A0A2H0WWR2_9BACT|nr:MAG: 50S ribosomal protein L34 [Candidatus Nealsonbacteria bacterium CG11_big_fil_rev_8_21_14_0_20_35_11]PIS16359.1 MAG: 50S ribosomal protein L34 [Candidatus Portnoybacteria bacterium CG09_land_8_20_14_0_10_44_13]PIZ70986.1 MAG: 50S ribosomal protein L34 [Candidatus Portnoybacteria bacterium CG_4_10_14_0_2_um_filter_44_20]